MNSKKFASMAAVALGLFLVAEAGATNGYFVHGYGTHYKAMGGAGVALPLSTLVSATNPAGMVFVGKRYDLGVALFNPNRGYTVTGAPTGFPGTFGLAKASRAAPRYSPSRASGRNGR